MSFLYDVKIYTYHGFEKTHSFKEEFFCFYKNIINFLIKRKYCLVFLYNKQTEFNILDWKFKLIGIQNLCWVNVTSAYDEFMTNLWIYKLANNIYLNAVYIYESRWNIGFSLR